MVGVDVNTHIKKNVTNQLMRADIVIEKRQSFSLILHYSPSCVLLRRVVGDKGKYVPYDS
jgi:hypothetical protein